MPLQFLIPAMLRVTTSTSPSSPNPSQQEHERQPPTAHPLHALLSPVLLTSRATSQKYHTRIPQLFDEEKEPEGPEEEYIAYAYEKDKVPEEESSEDFEAQDRIKVAWLEKYERREYVPPRVFAPPPPFTRCRTARYCISDAPLICPF